MLLDMLYRHLVTLFLIALFSIMLFNQRSSRGTEQRYFWITVLSCLFLAVQDVLEVVASMDPALDRADCGKHRQTRLQRLRGVFHAGAERGPRGDNPEIRQLDV